MEINTGTDVYNSLNYTAVLIGQSENECEKISVEAKASAKYSESSAVIYEKSEQTDFSTYSVNSVQAASDSSAISKMRTYLSDLGFYEGEMSGGYTEKLKTAVKCFQNAYFGRQVYNVESGIPSGLQSTIESVGAVYYTNLTNSKLADALKKLGFGSNPSTETKKNFARIQTFLEKGMGCTKYQIAGIMGNIKQESNFSSTSSNGATWGILQWRDERRDYLETYASRNGYSYQNIGAQFAFFRYEVSQNWGKGDVEENAGNSHLVDAWKTLKNEYKYDFYKVSDFFFDKIEECKDNTKQLRRNYSSIIYQAIS